MDENRMTQDNMIPDVIDTKTGFLNRSGFYNFLTNALAIIAGEHKNLVILSIKLIDYKRISALWAQSESESVINASARIIADVLRGRAVCSRVSEDTFTIATRVDEGDVTTGNSIKEELTNRFDSFNKISSKDYSLNPAITIVMVPWDSNLSPEEVVVQMLAKRRELLDSRPQNRYSAMPEGENDPELRNVVNKILDTNDIDYHFQPIISTKTGEIIGYEALMRTPAKYGVSPLTMLKYATEGNRLNDIERATFFNVMRKVTELKDEIGNRKVFINSIPGHYLSKDDFHALSDKYRELLDDVVIEITEETDMEEDTVDFLTTHSRDYGFQVAVDDFGTGYSNVTNLLKFLPDYVKIDRSLISEVHIDPRRQHFVNTIIQFAHDNGFQALAEGVETSEELNAVIRMGADLVQGFYTARPEPVPLKALSQDLCSEISRANLDIVSGNSRQKVFLVKDERRLSLVDLSLQKYNILLLSGGDITLEGNPDFMSAVSIRIKDHAQCRLTIKNVSLGDVDTTPCIDLGKESMLVLNVEGNNVFTGNGIRVPAGAELKLEGSGNLKIEPTFTNAFGIGNDYRYAFGKITSEMTGTLEINISGENCVCIGGRSSDSDKAIELLAGAFKSICSASNCVCIGSYYEKVQIYISSMNVSIESRIDKGVCIGSMFGEQDTHIENASVHLFGAGNHITGIGSTERSAGDIVINDSYTFITFKGWNIITLGAMGGDLSIDVRHVRAILCAEGNIATGIGCRDAHAVIGLDNTSMEMRISSANCILFGCKPEAFTENLNSYDIKRDGSTADQKDWFGYEEAEQIFNFK